MMPFIVLGIVFLVLFIWVSWDAVMKEWDEIYKENNEL